MTTLGQRDHIKELWQSLSSQTIYRLTVCRMEAHPKLGLSVTSNNMMKFLIYL